MDNTSPAPASLTTLSPTQIDRALKVLQYDALADAEEVTGKSYKDDGITESLGFVLHLDHVQNKRALMQSLNDTAFSNELPWTLGRLMQDGFDILLTIPFLGMRHDPYDPASPRYDERAYVLWCKRRGLLAWVESYARGSTDRPEGSVNMITVYFNWRPANAEVNTGNIHYSGCGFIDPAPLFRREPTEYNPEGHVYAITGSFDGREGLFTRLAWMEANGQFITPWLQRPWMWLLTYMDTQDPALNGGYSPTNERYSGYDYAAINASRIAQLPAEVQAALGPVRED